MNSFLKTRAEVDAATKYLQDNNLVESGLSCKNWEIASLIPYLKDGDILDMGSEGSVVLPNAVNLKGRKVGIDLAYEESTVTDWGAELYKGDLMNTPFNDSSFDTITCLSVIEHDVDFAKLAVECSRLLRKGGKVYVSFDYWEPKPDTAKMKLYSLNWNILDWNDVMNLIKEFGKEYIFLALAFGTVTIDWTIQDAVINPQYCSPAQGISYTFGIFEFIKV